METDQLYGYIQCKTSPTAPYLGDWMSVYDAPKHSDVVHRAQVVTSATIKQVFYQFFILPII